PRLTAEPLRPDYLLLRRHAASKGRTRRAKTLRHLWRRLPTDTIVEYKSASRPYRHRNLDRVWSYLHVHYTNERKRLRKRSDVCGVLLVPARTRSLDADVKEQGLVWRDLGDGYWELEGGAFALYVVEIDTAADAEGDDLLRLFGHGEELSVNAERWLAEQIG